MNENSPRRMISKKNGTNLLSIDEFSTANTGAFPALILQLRLKSRKPDLAMTSWQAGLAINFLGGLLYCLAVVLCGSMSAGT